MNTLLPECGQAIGGTPENFRRECYDVPYPHGVLHLGTKTCVMGILNVTPDSFYDGKRYDTHEGAVEHALRMVKDGASIIDIGGESTRPGAFTVPEAEEIKRVIPVIKLLSKRIPVPISVDTSKATVAEKAIDAGASMINDVGGLRDERMARVAAASQVPVIIMHKKGTPRTMQKYPIRKDACREIMSFFKKSVSVAIEAGIRKDRIILDPGVGFGKTVQQNLEILKRLWELSGLGFPFMVGTSRKKFIGAILDLPVQDRLYGTLATLAVAVMNGAHLVRVHDVREAVQTVTLCDAIRNS